MEIEKSRKLKKETPGRLFWRRFKKNILLMSLLTSLIISVLYYVAQMMAVLMAKLGLFTPLMGAWTAFILFQIAALWLFRMART